MITFYTLINTFSNTSNNYLIDLSVNCKAILVLLNSCKSNCLITLKGITDTLAPRSHNTFENSMLSIMHCDDLIGYNLLLNL